MAVVSTRLIKRVMLLTLLGMAGALVVWRVDAVTGWQGYAEALLRIAALALVLGLILPGFGMLVRGGPLLLPRDAKAVYEYPRRLERGAVERLEQFVIGALVALVLALVSWLITLYLA